MKQSSIIWWLAGCCCMGWLRTTTIHTNVILVAAAEDSTSSMDEDDSVKVVVVSSLIELGLDDNGKLKSHTLVYAAMDDDDDMLLSPCGKIFLDLPDNDRIALVGLKGPALHHVFPDYTTTTTTTTDGQHRCEAAFLERGTDQSVLGYPLPTKRWLTIMDDDTNIKLVQQSLERWYNSECWRIEICIMNYLDQQNPINVYWIHSDTRDHIKVQTLGYGERNTKCFYTYIGHEFVIQNHLEQTIDGYYNEETGNTFTAEFTLILGFGQAPGQTEVISPDRYDREIERTLRNEWARHEKPKKSFSRLGFSKGKLPPDVFASMGSFFYNNRNHKHIEEWKGKGVFVNWWETEVFMLQAPWRLKEIWQVRLADLVSQWAGMPCTQTVMYGLRQYESGARLLTHVDRLSTHVVSLIVNIAQGNLSQDWPVEVYDHAGRLHEVVMEPGDIVYYESAKNLHSRNRPLMGDNAYYVNLFTHYRPSDMNEQWWQDTTVTPGREPLLDDDIGDITKICTVPSQVTSVDTEYLGYGQVQCQDRRLGQHLSPSLFVAENSNDLIEWWRRTTPPRSNSNTSSSSNLDKDEIPTDAHSEL